MTALENVLMGFWFGKKEQAGSLGADRDQARELLSLAGLVHKETIRARELTLSEQRRLEVARALATRPHLLLLDEVAAGLSPKAVKQAVYLVERLQERGLTLLIIDHFLNLSLKVSHRLVALDQGEIIASGPPKEVIRHPEVMAAYLGTREGTNP
jgi:branched-chain amino acid transport system ATP-binding protein